MTVEWLMHVKRRDRELQKEVFPLVLVKMKYENLP